MIENRTNKTKSDNKTLLNKTNSVYNENCIKTLGKIQKMSDTHSTYLATKGFLIALCLLLSLTDEVSSSLARPLHISRPNDTSVRISWENFSNQKRLKKFSCGVEYYKVKLRFNDKTVQTWQVGGKQKFLRVDDPYLEKLKAVQVRALMCDGDTSLKTSWVKINSTRSHNIKNLLEPPESFTAVSIENNILVKWQTNERNKDIEGYIVSYGEGVPDILFKYVPIRRNNITLEHLKYSTMYVVGIRTFYKSIKSEALYKDVKTKEKLTRGLGVPQSGASSLPPPTLLRLKTLSSKSIELEWKDPSLFGDQKIFDERFYVVHYTNMKTQQNTSIIVKALHVTVHNLEADCWYVFKVRIGKGALSSPYTDGIPGKTLKMDLKNNGLIKSLEKEKKSKRNHRHQKKEATRERKIKRYQRNHKSYKSPFKPLSMHQNHSKKHLLGRKNRQIINMKKKMQFNFGAFITWPKSLVVCNDDNKASSPAERFSYIFRFKRSDGDFFTETNLTENYKYVDNILFGHSYVYQVRYLHPYDQGWSQEEILQLPNK